MHLYLSPCSHVYLNDRSDNLPILLMVILGCCNLREFGLILLCYLNLYNVTLIMKWKCMFSSIHKTRNGIKQAQLKLSLDNCKCYTNHDPLPMGYCKANLIVNGLWWRKVQWWLEGVQHEAKQEQAARAQNTKTPPAAFRKKFFNC